ncbi:hypothetical protein TNCV_3353701 [Trichonephila clavipes]|nr:hypothetical protein TNCV_3353701 [Trichonephila clavipes]
MTETGNAFPIDAIYATLHQAYGFQWLTNQETVHARLMIGYPMYRGRSEHDLYVILLVEGVWQTSTVGYNHWIAPMPKLDGSRRRSVSSDPPDTYKAIRILRVELELVSKDAIVPLLYRVLLFSALESPSLSMLHCKGSRSDSYAVVEKCKRIRKR